MVERAIFPLQVRGLAMRFNSHAALRDVNFVIDGSRRVAILGANGAGKSVLLRVLHGLLAPSAGEILWAGSRARPVEQAMVFQRPVMLRRTALANLTYALSVRGVGRDEALQRATEALDRVGLPSLAHRQARVLSGGEQQRLALARAWALRPRVIFLDEPTASVDPAAANEVERVIGEIHAAGTTLVVTTHNLGFARRVSDEVLFLHEGTLTERAATDRFFSAPQSPEASAFLRGELP